MPTIPRIISSQPYHKLEPNIEDYFYQPEHGHGLPHDPLLAIVAPRPIAWISTVSEHGFPNLAPYSFYNIFSKQPPIVGFCSTGWKHTVENIQATGEFVTNYVSRDFVEKMNLTSGTFEREIDEFRHAGIEQAPSRVVGASRVAGAAAALECKALQIQRLKDLEGTELESWLVLGQVVGVHIAHRFLKEGIFDTAAARPIMRAGYRGDYFEAGDKFELIRPLVEGQ